MKITLVKRAISLSASLGLGLVACSSDHSENVDTSAAAQVAAADASAAPDARPDARADADASDAPCGPACELRDNIALLQAAITATNASIVQETTNRDVAESMANEAEEARVNTAFDIRDLGNAVTDLKFQIGVNAALIGVEVLSLGYCAGIATGCKLVAKGGKVLSTIQKARKISKTTVGVWVFTGSVKHSANDPPAQISWTTVVPIAGEAAEIIQASNEIFNAQQMIQLKQSGMQALIDQRDQGQKLADAAQAKIEALNQLLAQQKARLAQLQAIAAAGGCPVGDISLDGVPLGLDDPGACDTPPPPPPPKNCVSRSITLYGTQEGSGSAANVAAERKAAQYCGWAFDNDSWRLPDCSQGTYQFGTCSDSVSGSWLGGYLTIAQCGCSMQCCGGGQAAP